MELTEPQIDRYARHIILREIGGPGQVRLLQSRVLVVGAGGLGSPLILYLAAAGVGTIGVVDDDAVAHYAGFVLVHDAGGNHVKYEFRIADYYSVTGVSPALIANYDIGF